jgi:hypothetical protein
MVRKVHLAVSVVVLAGCGSSSVESPPEKAESKVSKLTPDSAGTIHLKTGPVPADDWWEDGEILFYRYRGEMGRALKRDVAKIEGTPKSASRTIVTTTEYMTDYVGPADCRALWAASFEDARKEGEFERCVENTSDTEYLEGSRPSRVMENRRRARANAAQPVRSRLDADDRTIAAIRRAIAIYYGQNGGNLPPSREVVATLVTPPPSFQCPGNDFKYNPRTGQAALLIDDPSGC